MKSKILIFFIFFVIFISSCAKFKGPESYLYIPELYNNSSITAYKNGNITVTLHLVEESCDKLDYDACNLLGELYLEGKYINKSESKAFSLFNRGCLAKHSDSCLNLGKMYNAGIGTKVNDKKRDEAFQQAFTNYYNGCMDNQSDDCYKLGQAYIKGYLYDPAYEGPANLEKSCNLNNSEGCMLLGDYFYYMKNSKEQSLIPYEKSCLNHNPAGCIKFLDLYNIDREFSSKNISEIMAKVDKMCKSGASNLCVFLGDMYKRYTKISRINKEKSFDYMRYSCEFNNPYGCKLLGDMYSIGYGIKSNDGSAKSSYNKACSLGYAAACNFR